MANRAIKGRHPGYDNRGQVSYDTDPSLRNRPPSISSISTTKSDVPITSGGDDGVGLKKKVGLTSGTALIVGTMIGSGIFISPKGVVEGSGSVGLSLVSWVVCGLISTMGALSYAELGTMIPKSGGEYTYLLDTFQPLNRHVGSIPAFLFAWMNTLLLRPASIAIIVLAFASYTLSPFYELCESSVAAEKCLAAFIILLLMLINCLSVRVATGLQVIFTIGKVVSLTIIVLGGFVMLGQGHTQYLATGFEGTESNAGKIAIGLYNGMWAYDGWNNLNYVTEEIINPYVNLPRSIMIGIPLVTVLYVLVNISYFSVLSVAELLASPAVAITWGRRVLGVAWPLIPIFVACSTFGAANGTFFTAGRLTYVAAREGHMVELLSMVHVKRFTPLPSLVFTCIIALIMIIPGDIASLIDFFSFAVWMFYGATMLSLIVLRFTMKDAPRPYKVPIILPVFVLIVSIYLVFAPIIDDPRIEFLYAAIFILAGLIFYVPFVHYKVQVPGISAFTLFMQLFMECSPATGESTTI